MSTLRTAFTGTKTALALTLSLFALWGIGQHYYNTMMPQVSSGFHFRGFALVVSQYMTTMAYFAAALPAAFYARRMGYKAAVLCALGCISIGCFTLYPAVALHGTGYYFFAVVTLAVGWVFLEVTANPLVANLGPDEGFVWRLNLAQAIYPVGTMVAILAGHWLLGTYLLQTSARFVFSFVNPYILLGAVVFLIAYWFEDTRFPPIATERASGGEGAVLRGLLSDRLFLYAMAAQGLGIAILIVNGVKIIGGHYLTAAFNLHLPGPLSEVYFWGAIAFALGRFAGCGLMRFIAPARLLAAFAIGGCVSSLFAMLGWTTVSGIAILANQVFVSIMWPTILGLAIRGRGSRMQVATALICIGSAVGGTLAQMYVTQWPALAVSAGMFVPAACFLAIFGFARAVSASQKEPAAATRPSPAVPASS